MILVHRHPCPRCAKVVTERRPAGECAAYDGEPLRCPLCQVEERG